MKAKLITTLIGLLLRMLTPELLKRFADMLLDFIEKKVIGSQNTVDDAIILPLCDMIRTAFDIPDNNDIVIPDSMLVVSTYKSENDR